MKRRDFKHITKSEHRSNLLMFIETLEELLFYYSFESYKLPALNSHYLCFDIMCTKSDIDAKKITEGNFVPLSEEFEEMISEDLVLSSFLPPSNILLARRDKTRKIIDDTKLDNKGKLNQYFDIVSYIAEKNEIDNTYLNTLFQLLQESIFCKPNEYSNMNRIYKLTRELATEFVNGGYSPEYIRQELMNKFMNLKKPIIGSKEELMNFFNQFSFEEKSFRIYFGINKEAARILDFLNAVEINDPSSEIMELLNLKHKRDKVIVMETTGLDKYMATRKAYNIITMLIALYRISQHNRPIHIKSNAVVYEIIDEEVNKLKGTVSLNRNILFRASNDPQIQSSLCIHQLLSDPDTPYSFFQAVSMHNSALDSKESTTQLLDLWTAIEILIEIKVSDHDKIIAICDTLTCILCREYFYNHMEQLNKDLSAVLGESYIHFLESVPGQERSELKLTKLLSVKKYSEQFIQLYEMLEEYPLLQYRLKYFSDYIFQDSKSVYEELIRHKNKLKWQIMRIYRNRNLIVHNGKSMPYLDVILGNLHYYVDSLFNVLIEQYLLGFNTNHLIYFELQKKELQYWKILGLDDKGQKISAKSITEENYKEIIFNGYEGNTVKNFVREYIEETDSNN